jgi:SOS-response transcriptional repressor LexA
MRDGPHENVEAQTPGGTTIVDALVKASECTALLRVKGDSMVDAGLYERDAVVVERSNPARPSGIVVSIFDGEYTVKHLTFDAPQFYPRAINDRYAAVWSRERPEIYGLVVGMFCSNGR